MRHTIPDLATLFLARDQSSSVFYISMLPVSRTVPHPRVVISCIPAFIGLGLFHFISSIFTPSSDSGSVGLSALLGVNYSVFLGSMTPPFPEHPHISSPYMIFIFTDSLMGVFIVLLIPWDENVSFNSCFAVKSLTVGNYLFVYLGKCNSWSGGGE